MHYLKEFSASMIVALTAVSISVFRVIVAGVYRRALADHLPIPILHRILYPNGISTDKLRKLHENLFYCVWHTVSTMMVVYTMISEEWFWFMLSSRDARWTLTDWPHSIPGSVRGLYLLELGFWISCIAFLTVETQRKDFLEMGVHHATTVALIGLSYTYGYYRIGLLVMALHDVGDIFLYSAKFFNYLRATIVTNALFGLFVVVFFISRLMIFPSVIRAAWGPITGYLPEVDYRQFPGSYILPGLLTVLQVLHVLWFVLILKMLHRMFIIKSDEPTKDIRSEDEQEMERKESLAATKKK